MFEEAGSGGISGAIFFDYALHGLKNDQIVVALWESSRKVPDVGYATSDHPAYLKSGLYRQFLENHNGILQGSRRWGYTLPMHELAITKGILAVAVEAADQAGGKRITRIDLVIGELSSIVDDSVQFYFDILSEDTIAAEAELFFRREPAYATCMDCSHKFEIKAPIEPVCPACNGILLEIQDGNEFYVESIEVENENSSRKKDS